MKRFVKKILSFLLTIAVLFGIWFFFHGWIERQIQKARGLYYIHKGDQAYAQENIEKTLYFYKKGLSLYPKHYEAWFNLGNIYTVYEDYYSAVDAYQNAIKYNPKFVMARMNLGIIYSEELGFFDEAIEQFETIPNIKLWSLWIPFIYSNVKSIRGNKGIAYYNEGVAYKQKAMFLPLEQKYMMRQYLADAINAYTKSLKYLKKNYDVYYNRAVAHHLRGDTHLAGLDYCKAIELKPTKYEAHYNLAVLLSHLKYYREALKEMQKANSILTGTNGNSNQTRYMFDVMSDVTRNVLKDEGGMKYLTEEYAKENKSEEDGLVYVDGKVIASEDLDKSVTKSLGNCPARSIFRDEDDLREYNDVGGILN